MTGQPDDEQQQLVAENAKLRARLAALENTSAFDTVAKVSSFAFWKIVAGRRLESSLDAVLSEFRASRTPSTEQVAYLVGAVFRRLARVGLIALSLAVLPTTVLIWQTFLVREQNGVLLQQTKEMTRSNEAIFAKTWIESKARSTDALRAHSRTVGASVKNLAELHSKRAREMFFDAMKNAARLCLDSPPVARNEVFVTFETSETEQETLLAGLQIFQPRPGIVSEVQLATLPDFRWAPTLVPHPQSPQVLLAAAEQLDAFAMAHHAKAPSVAETLIRQAELLVGLSESWMACTPLEEAVRDMTQLVEGNR